MKIAIACDHGALALKEAVKAHLTARDMECVDSPPAHVSAAS